LTKSEKKTKVALVRRVPPSAAADTRHEQAHQARKIGTLLADLGAQLCLGGRIREPTAYCPTGVLEVDRLLGGGFPLGALCEISGSASSGRTSVALSLLARATRAGELAGLVDAADAFDPISAERAGVDLDRVLWVRPRSWQEALRSSERLIQTEGFPLVLFDWTARRTRVPAGPVPSASWIRLTRLAASTRTAVLLLSAERLAGSHAAVALELRLEEAHFTGTPALLDRIEIRAALVRHRARPAGQTTATFCLGLPRHPAFPPAAPHLRRTDPRFPSEPDEFRPAIPPDPTSCDAESDSRPTDSCFHLTSSDLPLSSSDLPTTSPDLPTRSPPHESAA
jgi:hypothetical protein